MTEMFPILLILLGSLAFVLVLNFLLERFFG